MRKLGIILVGVLCIVAIAALAYERLATHTFRYRLSLLVDDNGRLTSGSSVIEVISRLDFVPGRPIKYTRAFRGEAAFVDLGGGRNLFALLQRQDGVDAAYYADSVFFSTLISVNRTEAADRLAILEKFSRDQISRPLEKANTPQLVAFRDLNDPTSVYAVSPDHLDAALGQGVRLERVEVQMTTDPITAQIVRQLPWLDGMKGYLDGRSVSDSNRLANRLSASQFVRPRRR
ncbi:MAG: hypothetical protein K2Y27_15210 [Xanthobacteraceae bacterium]|nr:hypothetical protein [Xanthobacteraceae bacterium]